MIARADNRKTTLLDDASGLISERPGPGAREELEHFIQFYYKNVIAEDLLQLSPQNIYGAALAHYKLAATRRPGEALVRVYTPRIEAHGWQVPYTVIEIVNDDMPFLLDSVSAAISRRGLGVHLVAHPVMSVLRTPEGCWNRLSGDGETGGKAESFIHIMIDEQPDAAKMKNIRDHLVEVLADVRAAVGDWRQMLSRVDTAIAEVRQSNLAIAAEEIDESIAFLEWLRDNHFTLLGYAELTITGDEAAISAAQVPGSGLGVLRNPDVKLFRSRSNGLVAFSPEILESLKRPGPLIITKTDVRSSVHRDTHMDYIGVKRYDSNGTVIGERRFVGLFTSGAYSLAPADIPLLRRKVALTIARAGFARDSHDGKAMQNILDTYPRDELFQTKRDALFHHAIAILRLQERPRTRLIVRVDPFDRYISCLVYIPRERYDAELQQRIGAILAENFNGTVTTITPEYGDSPLARVHFIITTSPGALPEIQIERIEAQIDQAGRTWRDELRVALLAHAGGGRGLHLWERYAKGFPPDYKAHFPPELASLDIERMEKLLEAGGIHVSFYRTIEDPESCVRFKLFRKGEAVPLSDCMPMLERMGFRVTGEHPYEIEVSGETRIWLHDFEMREANDQPVDLGVASENLEDLFTAIWHGAAENDGFNRLVLGAGLIWREAAIVRAYGKYLRQAGIPYSNDYMERALCAHPAIVRQMIDLFHTRFDVDFSGEREAASHALREAITLALDAVESLDEDRILRRFLNLIACTLRTNFYQITPQATEKDYISFKLDSALVDELPLPRPMVEIFVYSPRVEGVHLRFGKVARGGLRWSDRREDFRTEVLGLVKAQQVKNAVIIPVGSKGGFFPKRLPAGGARDAIQEEGVAAYRMFISGLLDLTDNIVDAKVSPPARMLRYDADDPYLVVAADKGTATFSDIANGVAHDYGFWLDDAFASGGSVGYDHKKMAITARGAWEAVKRHFRERHVDIQTTPFTVIGCGDMSGDVFGNGMLLSRQTRLLAAFDHRDIFIDPDPDPALSFAERARLFDLPRSSWADYDAGLISAGGGVFSRTRKSIPLTPQMQHITGLTQAAVTPAELIHALLAAEADLLWFGGIGTYVKASHESNLDAGDKANDTVRIDGAMIRAKVIGEGANLGCTQLGRVEYALTGGAINTDAVDNSAGVDCSDHEVNIKIALGHEVRTGDLPRKQRDQLLASMTDEVAELVLRDNYQQTLAISLEASLSHRLLDAHAGFVREMERAGQLNRKVEFLPDDAAIGERSAAGLGLTRPEIAVLMAYAKNGMRQELLGSDVLDSEFLHDDLITYFPKPLREKYAPALLGHQLRREIVASKLANSIVNRAGVTFVSAIAEETGFSMAEVVRAFVVARAAFDMRAFWQSLEALDNKVPPEVQTRIQLDGRDLIRRATIWFLRNVPQPMDIGAIIAAYRPGISQLRSEIHLHLSPLEAEAHAARLRSLLADGAPEDIAMAAAGLQPMGSAADMVMVARADGRDIGEVAAAFFRIGAELSLDWLCGMGEKNMAEGHWERLAMNAMIDDFYGQQRVMTAQALSAGNGLNAQAAVTRWCEQHGPAVRRTVRLIDEMRSGSISVAKLAFVNRQMRDLLNK
ncbi:MAG: NAD-glutamate dehydrogenase [Alphaproteobacteria bacterium]